MDVIYLQPFGDVNYSTLNFLRDKLSQKFSVECRTRERVDLTEEAYDPARKQHKSAVFLDQLRVFLSRETSKCLAVVDVDIYAPGLNFIFGEAEVRGRFAVISLFRLWPQFYGLAPDTDICQERALKEAVHELGHTFGLGHCGNPTCVMHFSNSIDDTDKKSDSPCSDCQSTLANKFKDLNFGG